MSGFDAIASLAEAGIAVDEKSDEERAVLASLSEAEVGVLTAISARINAADPDLPGRFPVLGGAIW